MTTSPTASPPARLVGSALLAVPAILATGASAWLTYDLFEEYGGVSSDLVSTVVSLAVAVVVTALVVVPFAFLSVLVGWPDRIRGRVGRMVIASLAIVTVALLIGALLGGSAHDRKVGAQSLSGQPSMRSISS